MKKEGKRICKQCGGSGTIPTGPEVITVRIKGCSSAPKVCWYSTEIGEVFLVTSQGRYYRKVGDYSGLIVKTDCEPIPSYDKTTHRLRRKWGEDEERCGTKDMFLGEEGWKLTERTDEGKQFDNIYITPIEQEDNNQGGRNMKQICNKYGGIGTILTGHEVITVRIKGCEDPDYSYAHSIGTVIEGALLDGCWYELGSSPLSPLRMDDCEIIPPIPEGYRLRRKWGEDEEKIWAEDKYWDLDKWITVYSPSAPYKQIPNDIYITPIKQEDIPMTKELKKLHKKIDELQDFAIWMTGCGYDFCKHDYFIQHRDTLLKDSDPELDEIDPRPSDPSVDCLPGHIAVPVYEDKLCLMFLPTRNRPHSMDVLANFPEWSGRYGFKREDGSVLWDHFPRVYRDKYGVIYTGAMVALIPGGAIPLLPSFVEMKESE